MIMEYDKSDKWIWHDDGDEDEDKMKMTREVKGDLDIVEIDCEKKSLDRKREW